MVGFDDGSELEKRLDGAPADAIYADLAGALDLTKAKPLPENFHIASMGDTKVGPFDIDDYTAQKMIAMKGNPNGQPNSDVVVPWVNGLDVTRRPRNMWIIDFGVGTSEEEAVLYEAPFEYIRQHVRPGRATARSGDRTGVRWWLHQRPRPAMRNALDRLPRYLGTARVAKHRLFVWLKGTTLPDVQIIAFARDDDYFFGVLHSRAHELWALRMGSSLEDRPRYTPTTCFETFPLPWRPGEEPAGDLRVEAIAETRAAWTNSGATTWTQRAHRRRC
jgi:hypothetical protein